MGKLVAIGGEILSRVSQRVEVSAQNMANLTTPGYKARKRFDSLMAAPSLGHRLDDYVVFDSGKSFDTDSPFDLAIAGAGFFVVRSDDALLYTRNGQFSRNAEGRLVTPEGMVLQSAAGDIVVDASDVTVLADGTVLNGAEPVARVALADFADRQVLRPVGAGLFAAPAGIAHDVASPQVRQGMLEASNVSAADEMLSIMAALRSAETGQRVVQIYDDLMGRALTAFGQG